MSAIGALLEARSDEEKLAEAVGFSEIEDRADFNIDIPASQTSEEMLTEAKKRFRQKQ